jgi:hypothetical protein
MLNELPIGKLRGTNHQVYGSQGAQTLG